MVIKMICNLILFFNYIFSYRVVGLRGRRIISSKYFFIDVFNKYFQYFMIGIENLKMKK